MRRDDYYDDEDDDYEPRRKRGGRGATVLRFISPSTFTFAAVLFFLPWTDLSCYSFQGKKQLVVQSGYQSTTGEYSEGSAFVEARREMQAEGVGEENLQLSDLKKATKQHGEDENDGPDKTPLLWLYFGLLIAGALVPVLIGGARLRGIAILAFAVLAFLILTIQTAADFNKQMENDINEAKKVGAGGPFGDEMKPVLTCTYLPCYWLSHGMLVAAGVLGAIQVAIGPKKRKARSRRDDWYDEDEYEDD